MTDEYPTHSQQRHRAAVWALVGLACVGGLMLVGAAVVATVAVIG
jgi:hypothetical protein